MIIKPLLGPVTEATEGLGRKPSPGGRPKPQLSLVCLSDETKIQDYIFLLDTYAEFATHS